MSEAETWQVMWLAVENSLGCITVILTMCFAYIAAAYFVGNRLSRTQTLLVTLVFLTGAGMMTVGLFGTLTRYVQFISILRPLYPDQRFIMTDYWVLIWTGLMAVITLASTYFMYQIRKDPTLGAGAAKPL